MRGGVVALTIALASCGGRIASEAQGDAAAPTSSPAPSSTCGAKQAPPGAPAFVARLISMNLGDLDENGSLSPDAWRTIGFDVDGLCTARGAAGSCTRRRGASMSSQEDGDLGIDNAFARTVLPFVAPFVPDISRRSAGSSYLRVDLDRTGTLFLSDAIHRDFAIVVPLTDVRIEGDARSGTLSALVPVDDFAGAMSGFCAGATLDALLESIRQAADVHLGGPQPSAPCDAISLGMTYVGMPADELPIVPSFGCR